MAVVAMSSLVGPINAITKASSASESLFQTIDRPVASIQGKRDPEVSSLEDIVFEDVTFTYPTRPGVTVLDGINMRFEAGKITAIVGPSGSGKSTTVALLERWYQLNLESPSEGTVNTGTAEHESSDEKRTGDSEDKTKASHHGGKIKIGDTPLSDLDLKWWRSQIGLVQQEPFLFNQSIYQNVAYGLLGSRWEGESEEKKLELVKVACKEAFADEFIDKLPLV
jgi:ATP-binding cassette, subfamily B (MDR/TAP), member 1